QTEAAVWGSTDKGSRKITVITSWDKKRYVTTSDETGKWRLKVNTPVFGGPYQIEVSDGTPITINDVWVGEVWLCSGQSNMDMRVSGRYGDPVIGSLDAIVTADKPQIRMFTVGHKLTSEPQADCQGVWQAASSETIPEFSAAGYFFARKLNEVLGCPVGIIHTSCGGSRVEAWMSKAAITPYKETPGVRDESILFNGMLSPVIGYGIKGCLWYQGEANVNAPDLYTQLFPAMVADWRSSWQQGDFPFIYAQIAPFRYNNSLKKGENSAYLREAQLKCLDLIPASAMITLMDVGDDRTIHPMEKETVGNRFAYRALECVYGKKGFVSAGLVYRSMQIEKNEAILTFDNVGKGLTSYRLPLTDFEVAGEDQVFYPAKARFGKDMKTIIVSAPEVNTPVAVRYAFKNYTKGSFYNIYGIPASSFRTDNW
ncbi:MAG: sialate O-acetylesterase, partial [Bacteroides sp.]|nr:sialate O-acetylesterase [Bacteroides sp.]